MKNCVHHTTEVYSARGQLDSVWLPHLCRSPWRPTCEGSVGDPEIRSLGRHRQQALPFELRRRCQVEVVYPCMWILACDLQGPGEGYVTVLVVRALPLQQQMSIQLQSDKDRQSGR